MQIDLNISKEAEDRLRQAFGDDINEIVTESLLVNGYRTGRISLGLLATALNLPTTLVALQWLADRKIPINYDLDELEADRIAIRERFGVEI